MDAIQRLREIARQAAASGLCPTPPAQPDSELLDLCDGVLYRTGVLRRFDRAMIELADALAAGGAEQVRVRHLAGWLVFDAEATRRKIRRDLARAAKLPAATGPGLRAKAQMIRASASGAPALGASLARDVLGCRALRAALWPVG